MPVYEYRCHHGHEYELAQGFGAPSEHACPQCGQLSRRRCSSPAVIFKGSGFYSTDNRKTSASGGGNSNGASSESSPTETPSTPSSNGSESKAETKEEAKAAE